MLIERKITKVLVPLLADRQIICLAGAPRTGKSSIIQSLLQQVETPKLYLDLKEKEHCRLLQGKPEKLIKKLRDENLDPGLRTLIFLDGIQYLNKPSQIIPALHKKYPNLKFIISVGSSLALAKKFSQELQDLLNVFEISPLDFEEFLVFKGEERLCQHVHDYNFLSAEMPEMPEFFRRELQIHWEEFLLYGGYPEVVLSVDPEQKQKILKNITGEQIINGLQEIARVDNQDGLTRLLAHLARQLGNLMNYDEIASSLHLSPGTVKRYLLLLENGLVIKMLRPFFSDPAKEIIKMPKLFFLDSGLVNALRSDFSPLLSRPNTESLLKNAIFAQLWKQKAAGTVHYWRSQSKSDLDFVFKRDQQYLGIEVK